jgi:hypothetical protein
MPAPARVRGAPPSARKKKLRSNELQQTIYRIEEIHGRKENPQEKREKEHPQRRCPYSVYLQ